MKEKIQQHQRFWAGQGPSLLLLAPDDAPLYDTADYRRRFADPQRMWEAERQRAEALADWPTDGIPTVRPNLGVVFVPSIAGQAYEIQDGQMPWPGAPLSSEQLQAVRSLDIKSAELMVRAEEFYRLHRMSGRSEIAAYHPDTQGIFDVAHLLVGDGILTAMAGDDAERTGVHEVLEICLDLYVRVTRHIKAMLGESAESMIHGHGTAQGVFFPHGGTRVSEDSATLLSPSMIDCFVMPYVERAVAPFGGGFLHFCGLHKPFFSRLCRCELVRAIDLGNLEKYDPRWLLECCAETGTVLYSRLPGVDGEKPLDYVRRIGTMVRQTGARLILRSTVQPGSRDEAREMLEVWHQLTN